MAVGLAAQGPAAFVHLAVVPVAEQYEVCDT